MDLFRGRDVGGRDVLFVRPSLPGEVPDADTLIAQAVKKRWGGVEWGMPAPGTTAIRVATVSPQFAVDPVARPGDEGEVVVVSPSLVLPADIGSLNKRLVTSDEHLRLFAKADADGDTEEGIATGIVMEPTDGEDSPEVDPDTDNEVASAEVIRKGMIAWMLNGGMVDLMHSFAALADEEVRVIECWQARSSFPIGPEDQQYDVRPGTWMLSTLWDTDGDLWTAIKGGLFASYSPGGLCRKVPLEEDDG